jgi:type I restriction enzyme S subunit
MREIITVSIPPLNEQKSIVKQLDALSNSINLNHPSQTKLTSLEELKKSILQKAFAGELT